MKKEIRIKKFNGGAGALLCNKCRTIIKEGFFESVWAVEAHKRRGTYPDGLITKEDWASKEPMYCDECKSKNKK
jgi:hypothetical protein